MNAEAKNPLLTIKLAHVATEGDAVIYPQDFASTPLIRALIPATERRVYAGLRAYGLSSGEAFSAVFARHFVLSPDAIIAAAAVYDQTAMAKRELLAFLETCDRHTLRREWKRQISLLAAGAEDAALSIRVQLANYEPAASAGATERDHARLRELLAKNAAAIAAEEDNERETGRMDWDRDLGTEY